MNTTNPLHVVLALALVGALVCFAIFRPNSIRRLFGIDGVSGTDGEVQVLRDKLKARAENVAREMAQAGKGHGRLEKEIDHLRHSLDALMRHAAIEDTEYPDLWREAARRPDEELVAEFDSLAKQVGAARRDLAAGGNPREWGGILDEARKKAQLLAEDTGRRREALEQIKRKFVRAGG